MWNRRHRWIRRLTGGLAFAVLVVPTAAQGRIVEDTGVVVSAARPDDRSVRFTPQGEAPVFAARPDDRSVRFTPQGEAPVFAARPDDRSIRFTPQGEAPVVFAAPSDGFNWGDAGIGAGIGLGAALLALGAAAVTRRHGGRGTLAGA
jgi:hypothetical protein